MKIKLIDFGYVRAPHRAHHNDAGADVYANANYHIAPGEVVKVPLGFGLQVPDGYAAYVYPRSGLASQGIVCELPPIDSGYRGEVHAIVHNGSQIAYNIKAGDRIGQLVVAPVVIVDFVVEDIKERGDGSFASTGR